MSFIKNQFTFTVLCLALLFGSLHMGVVGCSTETFQTKIPAAEIMIEDPETQFYYPDRMILKNFGRGSQDTSQVSFDINEDNARVWIRARYTVDPAWPDSVFIWPPTIQMEGTNRTVKLTEKFEQHYLGLAVFDGRYQLNAWGDRTGCDRGILCKPGDPGFWDKNIEIQEITYQYER